MDGAGRQHDLVGRDPLQTLVQELDPNGPLVLDEDANNGLAGEKGHAAQREMLSASLESIPLLVRGLMDSGHVFRTTRNDGATSTLLRLRPSGTSSACQIRST
jgi:hypothetical protein